MTNFCSIFQAPHSCSEHLLRQRLATAGQLRPRAKLVQGVLVRDAAQHDGREELRRQGGSQLQDGEGRTQECRWSYSGKVRWYLKKAWVTLG